MATWETQDKTPMERAEVDYLFQDDSDFVFQDDDDFVFIEFSDNTWNTQTKS